jgi:hypothetical protein
MTGWTVPEYLPQHCPTHCCPYCTAAAHCAECAAQSPIGQGATKPLRIAACPPHPPKGWAVQRRAVVTAYDPGQTDRPSRLDHHPCLYRKPLPRNGAHGRRGPPGAPGCPCGFAVIPLWFRWDVGTVSLPTVQYVQQETLTYQQGGCPCPAGVQRAAQLHWAGPNLAQPVVSWRDTENTGYGVARGAGLKTAGVALFY